MMNDRLVIRNFGPIRAADLRAQDLTVFVEPQATGKSLAAQLLCFFRGIEDLLSPDVYAEKSPQALLSALKYWLGTDLSTYATP